MAKFDANGLDGLQLSLEEIADLPEDVEMDMLMAEGQIVKSYQEAEIVAQRLVDVGTLRDSIRVFPKNGRRGRYVLVYPYGKHGEYNRRVKVKTYKNSKHGRTYTVGGDTKEISNNEVGFVWEYGAPQRGKAFAARQWMRLANEKAGPAAVQAAAEVYSRWLEANGL